MNFADHSFLDLSQNASSFSKNYSDIRFDTQESAEPPFVLHTRSSSHVNMKNQADDAGNMCNQFATKSFYNLQLHSNQKPGSDPGASVWIRQNESNPSSSQSSCHASHSEYQQPGPGISSQPTGSMIDQSRNHFTWFDLVEPTENVKHWSDRNNQLPYPGQYSKASTNTVRCESVALSVS